MVLYYMEEKRRWEEQRLESTSGVGDLLSACVVSQRGDRGKSIQGL